MVGLGVKLNTGKHNVTDQAPQANGTKRIAVMDQAIQPGDGGKYQGEYCLHFDPVSGGSLIPTVSPSRQ